MTVALVALASAGPAHAGGATFTFDRESAAGEWYAPGDIAVARGAFGPGCCNRGWIEDGPYFVQIVPMDDGGNSAIGDSIPIGSLRIEEIPYDLNGAQHLRREAVVEFVVPEVPDGNYVLSHCNDPCTKQLGDLTTGWFRIGAPPVREPQPADASLPSSVVPSTTVSTAVAPSTESVLAARTGSRAAQVATTAPPTWVSVARVVVVLLGVGLVGVGALALRRRRRA